MSRSCLGHVSVMSRTGQKASTFLGTRVCRAVAPSRRTRRARRFSCVDAPRAIPADGERPLCKPFPPRHASEPPCRAPCGKNALRGRFRAPGRAADRGESRPDAPRVIYTDEHARPKHCRPASNASSRFWAPYVGCVTWALCYSKPLGLRILIDVVTAPAFHAPRACPYRLGRPHRPPQPPNNASRSAEVDSTFRRVVHARGCAINQALESPLI